jgi:hypothetical protein
MNQPQILTPSPLADFLNGLKDIITEAVKECLVENNKSSNSQDEYVSREDGANLLLISVQTLSRRTNTGEFKAYRIGSRVLYKRAELLAALQPSDRYTTPGKKRGRKPKAAA